GEQYRVALRHNRPEQRDLDLVHMRGDVGRGDRQGRGQDARRIMVLGDADPVEPQSLDVPAALDHATKGARACLAVVGAGRHRPFPRQVRGRVIAAGFEIRDLHFGTSPFQRVRLWVWPPPPPAPSRSPSGKGGRCACSLAWASSAAWSFHNSSRTSLSGSETLWNTSNCSQPASCRETSQRAFIACASSAPLPDAAWNVTTSRTAMAFFPCPNLHRPVS